MAAIAGPVAADPTNLVANPGFETGNLTGWSGDGALHAKALRRAREATDNAGVSRLLPDACSFGLDELLAGDLAGLTAELGTNPP